MQHEISRLQNSLIDRLVLTMGEKPYSLDDLKLKLSKVWGIAADWKLVPLGKGYYNINLPNLMNRDKILDKRACHLKLGIVRIQRWSRGFNPYKVNTSMMHIWVQIYEIS